MSGRRAFTWRLTVQQALMFDDLVLRLSRELDWPRLDKAEAPSALVGLAGENPAIFGALVARMQDNQASRRPDQAPDHWRRGERARPEPG